MVRDRTDGGRRLAELVADRLADAPYSLDAIDTVVMGLPRGGIPVAALVAEGLGVPLGVLVIRRVGVPWQTELARGAVGGKGAVVLNDAVVPHTGLGPAGGAGVFRGEPRAASEGRGRGAGVLAQSGAE